jgi:hypothetical protein
MFRERDRLLPGRCEGTVAWIVSAEQLHQGGRQLLGGPAGPLALEGMPITIADRQLPLELLRQGSCGLRPGVGGGCRLGNHWTLGQGSSHPGE